MKHRMKTILLLASVLALASGGCANVKPWQRGNLSDYTMRGDRDELRDIQREHVYFSREEATGGRSIGGGGCGCN
jgi:hypothetical protein